MLFLKKKKNRKKESFLFFDVNSFSISASVFTLDENNSPEILISFKEFLPIEKELTFESLHEATLKYLGIISKKIFESKIDIPKNVYCFLSSPWFISQNRVIKFEKTENFIFDIKIADTLIKKEIDFLNEEIALKNKNFENKIIPIELKIMSISLNGYKTKNPYNQKAKELEMSVFISFAEDKILKSIEDTIKKYFLFKKIEFVSFLVGSFAVSRDFFVHQNDFLLVNIGGEVTDISMIKKEIIKDSISFPLGISSFIRHILSKTKYSENEAVSFFSLYKENHMNEKTFQEFDDLLKDAKNAWLSAFQNSLNHLTHDIAVPSTIFFTVEKGFENFFMKIINTEEFGQYTLTNQKFVLIFLSIKSLHGIVSFKEKSLPEPVNVIESMYIKSQIK